MELGLDPLPLICTHGDAKAQPTSLQFLGWRGSARASRSQLALIKQRRAGGDFPGRRDRRLGGMQKTIRHPVFLVDAGRPKEDARWGSALRFLLRGQNAERRLRPFFSEESSSLCTVRPCSRGACPSRAIPEEDWAPIG